MSARIRGAKTDLEELGEEEDAFTQSTSKLRDLIKGLTGFDILESDEQTFKSIYDILVGIGEKWDDLTDVEQASLGEALAGKRNANALYAILNNLDTLESAYETATNSAGSAMREQQNFEQGLEYSTNRLKASLEELAADTLNSDFLKGGIDAGNTLVQLFDKLISSTGTLSTLAAGLGAIFGGKVGLFSGSSEGLMFGGKTFGENKESKVYRGNLKTLSNNLENAIKYDPNTLMSSFSEEGLALWLGGIDKVDARTKALFDTYRTGGKTAQEALEAVQLELGKVGKASGKFASTLKGLFSSLGAGLLNAAISFGISKLIEGAVSAVDHWIHKVEYAQKAIDNASTAYKTSKQELEQLNTELETSSARMDELLTKDSLTLVEEEELIRLKESNTELERQIRLKEREVELNARTAAETIEDEYNSANKNVNRAKEQSTVLDVVTKNTDAISGRDIATLSSATYSDIHEMEKAYKSMVDEYAHMQELYRSDIEDVQSLIENEYGSVEYFEDYFNKLGIAISHNDWVEDYAYDLEGELLRLQGYLDTYDKIGFDNLTINQQSLYNQIEEDIKWIQNQIYSKSELFDIEIGLKVSDKSLKDNISLIQRKLSDNDLFKALPESQQNDIFEYLLGLDEEHAQAAVDNIDDIIISILKQSAEQINPNLLKSYLEAQFDALGGDFDLKNRPKVPGSTMSLYGWDVPSDSYSTVDTSTFSNKDNTVAMNFTPIVTNEDGSFRYALTPEALQSYAERVIDGVQEDNLHLVIGTKFEGEDAIQQAEQAAEKIHKLQEIYFDDAYSQNSQLEGGFQGLRNLAKDVALFDFYSKLKDEIDSAKTKTEELAQATQELADTPRTTDLVDALAANKSALSSLEKLYDTSAVGDDGTATFVENFADPENLNSIESAFSELIQTLEKAGDTEGAQKLSLALSEFEKDAVLANGDTTKMQTAVDKLVTAQIQQGKVLEDVSEETAEYAKAQLTAQGVTNAETLVMERLSKGTQKLMKNLKSLAGVLNEDVIEALQNGDESSTEYQDGMSAIQKQLGSMYQIQDTEGNMVDFNFDPDWIISNLELITQAAAGSEEAIYALNKAAAQEIVFSTKIDIDEEDVFDVQERINGWIDDFDIQDIDIGANLDDTDLIKGLNNLVDAGIITRDSMNNILSGIGVVPDIQYEDAKIEAALESYANAPEYAKDAIRSSMKASGTFKVPKISYKLDSKATGARYSAPSGSTKSSGGGGGGGGGNNSAEPNKPKEEAEETFDWIEVAIQRLQEAETRLSKVVSDTYDIWGERNKALEGQIDNVTEQITAQWIAYQEYARNANAVQIKALNDADYGENDSLVKAADQALYDEAVAKWATGDYQKKVREGLLSGDDIEKIQNHFLSDAIKEFQELYNKAVQAGDAIKDDQIQLGDLAKTRFDNIKSEFDGLVGIIEAKAGLVEKRISKAQAKSYHADEKYYKQLIVYNEQVYAKTADEYKKLVEKRDKAVAEGSIKKGSEAWNQMTQEIIEVNGKLIELTTSTAEYRNEMNQIKWDKFEQLNEMLKEANTEMSDLIELMGNHELVEENGEFNEWGRATLAMYAAQYNALAEEQSVLQRQYEEAKKDFEENPLSNDALKKLSEAEQALRDNAKERVSMEKELQSVYQNAVDTRINYLNELIDKYSEALDAEKDLYSYQKNIQKQVENISHLERMLNVYEGDDSEEARKIRQVTGSQLEEARQQLEETEWDRMISETKKAMSDMSEDYSKFLNDAIKNISDVIKATTEEVNTHIDGIRTTLKTVAKDGFFSLSDELQNALNLSVERTEADYYGVAADILMNGNKSSWGKGSANQNKNLQDRGFNSDQVREIMNTLQSEHRYAGGSADSAKMQSIYAGIAYEILKTGKNSFWGSTRKEQVENWTKLFGEVNANQISAMADSMNVAHKNGVSWAELAEANGFDTSLKKYQTKVFGESWAELGEIYGFDASKMSQYQKSQYSSGFDSPAEGKEFISTQKQAYKGVGTIAGLLQTIEQELSDMHDNQKAAQEAEDAAIQASTYAKGSHYIPHRQLAVTQDDGSEVIFRAADGSLLTPLGTGDMVFTNEMSQRLWDIAKNGVPTTIGGSIPQVASNVGNTINQDNAISITLPNVTNYDDFKNALKKDTQFTNFVQEITVGQLAGNNTLKKNRY